MGDWYERAAVDRRARILIVDDDPLNRMVVRGMLAADGADRMEIIEAANGAEAMAMIDAGVDLVLLDILMPVMGGLEVCRRIKQERGLVFLPIILITSLDDRASRVAGKAAGADDFLSRPVDALELSARVSTLLEAKAYHDLRAHQQQRLEAELERIRASLIRADRLATVSNLAAAVSHEMRNMLTVLQAATDFVRRSAAQGKPADLRDIEALETVAAHLTTHAAHLVSIGGSDPGTSSTEDLGAIVRRTVDLLGGVGRTKGVRVLVEVPPQPVLVAVNRIRIEQVLVNLLNNAVDACQGSTRDPIIRVRLDTKGGQARCEVGDNGPGIPPEVMPRLFQMYFTTKGPQQGSGIGLAVMKTIVDSYHGEVAVEARPGEGAIFTFTLPLVAP